MTSSPDVSRSSRWTIPGRSSSPPAAPWARTPWTSVPVAWPGDGWTTTPAGLSTTRRWSSSYAIRSSTSSGASCGVASGGSYSTSSPPPSRRLLGAGSPSTATRPVSSSRSAAARVPISGRSARNRSSRSPAALSGTVTRARSVAARLPVGEEQRPDEDRHPGDDEAVREVERRPVAKIEEIRDMAEPDAVGEVRRAPAEEEAERDGKDRVPASRARKEDEHPGDRDRRERDHDGRCGREEPERDPRVLHVVNRERADDVHLVAERELGRDDPLRQLVGRDRSQ